MMPVFGFLEHAEEAFRELITNVLLVAGGFLVGYLLGGVIAWAIWRYALRQKEGTQHVKAVGKPVGGVILALIVALIVFTGMGKGPGDGGDGKGTAGDPNAGKATPKTDSDAKINPKIEVPKIDQKPPDVTLRVTIIAGTAVPGPGRYYLFEDDTAAKARTLTELQKAIEDRKGREKGKVSLAILFPADRDIRPSDRKESKVTDVTRWATEDAGLDVTFPAVK